MDKKWTLWWRQGWDLFYIFQYFKIDRNYFLIVVQIKKNDKNDMASNLAQHERSNIKYYASTFSIIQIYIKTILFIFYLQNPNIVTDNTKQNITKPKKKKKKKRA